MDLPDLSIHPDGSSGIEIRACLGASYNCVDFSTRADQPQTVFISPWTQFEPAELSERRLQLAQEIIRRANAYTSLLTKLQRTEDMRQAILESKDKVQSQLSEIIELWRDERSKLGLPEDFSDVKFKET